MATAVRKTNWFAIWVSVAVVVVVAIIAGLVIWMNASATAGNAPTSSSTAKPEAANIDTSTGAISFGTGTDKMDTFIDFMCPVCNQFEQTYGESISGLVADNKITLNIHPIAILDRSSQGTAYSSRAASAMYAVAIADPAKAYAFMQAMYASQPAEGSTGLTNAKIISIAEDAGVTMTDELKSAITDNKYLNYVQTMTPKTPIAPGSSNIGTPTIQVNGKTIANSTLPSDPSQLLTLFQ
ncbi:MAG: thioredoxin domain-containing protein [Microbacterium sp.]|uniref:DsbA family protein n=1 Tax=Microbacterium sp. TaxID=51671 RepID=UPI001AC68F45|nr:thioredoxin domain-containing protein [Microbacterium sp.]MBN9155000.1 thioredoxin domain-containing protein [Microbacterium sp.]MBN9174263.1 thioredoxin domain-containing protein [Microbacterium sp.]